MTDETKGVLKRLELLAAHLKTSDAAAEVIRYQKDILQDVFVAVCAKAIRLAPNIAIETGLSQWIVDRLDSCTSVFTDYLKQLILYYDKSIFIFQTFFLVLRCLNGRWRYNIFNFTLVLLYFIVVTEINHIWFWLSHLFSLCEVIISREVSSSVFKTVLDLVVSFIKRDPKSEDINCLIGYLYQSSNLKVSFMVIVLNIYIYIYTYIQITTFMLIFPKTTTFHRFKMIAYFIKICYTTTTSINNLENSFRQTVNFIFYFF
uniref:Uncharacterized protein n=1 Tax=Heterorhabditis bacteriophora TaxID=37862 RepID=A0A1I7WUX2_HETBA